MITFTNVTLIIKTLSLQIIWKKMEKIEKKKKVKRFFFYCTSHMEKFFYIINSLNDIYIYNL